MNAIQTALASVVGVFLLVAAASAAEVEESLTERLRETLDAFRERHDFPGATAAIALPDGSIRSAATGLSDIEAGREMAPDARMLVASVGKTFVGAIVLALEHEGHLAQEDLLADHLGHRLWFAKLPNARTITLGHLLRHRSGLPDHTGMPEFRAALRTRTATGAATFTPEGLLGFVARREPLFEAGAGWAYSDTGYILLGLVIEEVTGQRYYDVVQARLLVPLGLTDTIPSDRPELPGLAVGYTPRGGPFGLPERTADAGGRLVWDPAVEWTGGGLASTSRDLAKWGQLLFGGEALAAPYLDRLLEGVQVAADSPGIRYGAGAAVYERTPRGPVYGHGGWIPGYVSSLRHYADYRVTVAFQINSDEGSMSDGSEVPAALEAALADLAIAAVQ